MVCGTRCLCSSVGFSSSTADSTSLLKVGVTTRFLQFILVVSDSLEKFSFGFCVYSTVVPMVNLKLWFQSRSWNFPLVASILLSVLLYIVFNIGLAYLRQSGDLSLVEVQLDTAL